MGKHWERGNCGQEPLLWFPWEETGEGGEADLESASLNSFSGHWDVSTSLVVRYLALG